MIWKKHLIFSKEGKKEGFFLKKKRTKTQNVLKNPNAEAIAKNISGLN